MSYYLMFGNLRNRVWSDAYHSGSVSEFETTHGVTYGTPEAKKYAKDLNTKLGNNCV